jgi:SAM-dependent methyltransferase
MIWSVPDAVEAALWQAARARLPPAALAGPALHAAVVARSRRYTSERDQLSAPLSGAAAATDLAARALFFGLADAAKIAVPLAELAGRGLLRPAAAPLRLLDLGAGTGAMTLGTLAFLAGHGIRDLAVTMIDRDRAALALAAEAARIAAAALGVQLAIVSDTADVTSGIGRHARPGGWDLVVAGTLLNELDPPAALDLAAAMVDATAPEGATILMEPALRDTARGLHAIRDALLTDRRAFVFAPCTRTIAPCPALADERDWCHEDRPVALPERAAAIAAATGLRSHGMKFAYLVLRHTAAPLVASTPAGTVALRVVSQLQSSKGKQECFACGDAGRLRLRLLRRDRCLDNRDFERGHRGNVLIVPEQVATTSEVTDGDLVRLVRPAEGDPPRSG